MKLCIALLFVSLASAQVIIPTVSPASVTAGKTSTLTLTYTPGATASAAVQWSVVVPPGVTIALNSWSAGPAASAAGKTITCAGSTTEICVLAGLNLNTIGPGVVATATVTVLGSSRGQQIQTVTDPLGADITGSAVAITGGTANLAALSPFDLNGDGKVDTLDLVISIQQAEGVQACTTADFNGDGKCDVRDVILLVLDAMSPTP